MRSSSPGAGPRCWRRLPALITGETGSPVRAILCNVGDPAEVAAAFAAVRRDFGRLDVLVNNAGSNVSPALLEDIPFEEWSSILAANLTGAFLCTQAGLPPDEGRRSPQRRAHHQQRLDFRHHAATAFRALYRDQTRDHRPHQVGRARRPRKYDIACGQIDIGNASDRHDAPA
jgi:NAD(P)-dependent dehydrogenase (short-subunit alcohol dehydrogenase family)